MSQFVEVNFSLSTAEEERNQFVGPIFEQRASGEQELPPGHYRIVNDQLFQILEGIPSHLEKVRKLTNGSLTP